MDWKPYDGTKLLSLKDINGKDPEIYLCSSNRSAGKTTYFNRLLINRWKKQAKKFCLLYRYQYELCDCSDKFFKDISTLFFPSDELSHKIKAKGLYADLFLNDIHCGYAVPINAATTLKNFSHFFSDACTILFDEFQSESNHYCTEEINKFRSLHTTIARGGGKAVRHVPVYMVSNPVTLLNPYYNAMGIGPRLTAETHFLRGDGFVLEQDLNTSVANLQASSGFNRAFGNDEYNKYLTQAIYLNDNQAFIEKLTGKSRYLLTLKFENKEYGIREFADKGIIYCSKSVDSSCKFKLAATTEDHQINYVMINNFSLFISQMRKYFEVGAFRFDGLDSKQALMSTISY